MQFKVWRKPDIYPSSIHLSDSTPRAGDSIEISAVIDNLGDLVAEDAKIRILVDDFVISQAILDVGGGEDELIWAQWEAQSGWHTVKVMVNIDDAVDESNLTNNELTVDIFVEEPASERPVADAGPDVTVYKDQTVSFIGIGQDLDGQIVLYEWDLDGDGEFEYVDLNDGITENTYPTTGTIVTRFRVTDNEGSNDTDFKIVNVIDEPEPENQSPIAEAGNDITVVAGTPVALVGSAIDPDGYIVLFEWDSDDDGVFEWNDPNHGIRMKNFTVSGYYVVTLQVTDNQGATARDMVLVTVLDEARVDNAPPVADAGNDQQGFVDEPILFSGDATDADGAITLYEWDFDGDGTYDWNGTDHGVAKHTFDVAEVYIATFRVTDNQGATDTDVCVIQVEEEADTPNAPPTAEIQNDVKVNVNQATTLNGLGSDSDGTIVKYEWDFESDGVYDWNGTGSGVILHTYDKAGFYYAKLRVTDDEGATDTEVCEVTVIAPPESGDDSPGFGSLVALTALCLVAVVWRRKRIVD